MEPISKTCKCVKELLEPANGDLCELIFIVGHEYQVDIFDLFYQVYLNGGWRDYTFIDRETFNKHFTLI